MLQQIDEMINQSVRSTKQRLAMYINKNKQKKQGRLTNAIKNERAT